MHALKIVHKHKHVMNMRRIIVSMHTLMKPSVSAYSMSALATPTMSG